MKVLELKETLFQKYMRKKNSMKRILTVLVSALLLTGIGVQASDLIIESKNQTFSEKDSKIKFNGNVKLDAKGTRKAIASKDEIEENKLSNYESVSVASGVTSGTTALAQGRAIVDYAAPKHTVTVLSL